MRKVLSIILAIAVLVTLVTTAGCRPAVLSEEQIETIFEQEFELLLAVANYLKNSGLTSILIIEWTEDIEKITDPEIVEAIQELRRLGFRSVRKRENTIRFQSFPHAGGLTRGIAFSINGQEPTAIEFLVRIEPLSVSNWYFYVNDYNEWRDRNRDRG